MYVNSIMRLGASKHLDEADLWDVAKRNECATLTTIYHTQMLKTSDPQKHPYGSVGTALFRAFGPGWVAAGLLKLVHDCVNLSSPFILRQLLSHMQESGHRGYGLLWALALFACGVTVALLVNQYFVRVFNVSLFLKSSLIQFLYTKSLRLSLRAKAELGQGMIANLQSNDAAKLWNLAQYGHVIWSGPFQVMIIIYALHDIVGLYPALAGLAVTILLVPLNTLTGKIVHRFRKELIAKTDARVRIVSEIINGIKAIKLYAWEVPYRQRLEEARRQERLAIRKTQLMSCVNTVMFSGGPIIVADRKSVV